MASLAVTVVSVLALIQPTGEPMLVLLVLWITVADRVPLSVLGQPPQLLSEERLAEEAIFIGSIKNNHIHQALFPDICFTCAGNLTRWTLVAVPVGGGSRYPQLHVWRPNGQTNTFTRHKRNKLDADSPNPLTNIYEAYRDPPLAFQAGDVLGVYNPTVPRLSLRYQSKGGPINYFIDGAVLPSEEFDLDAVLVQESRNDYPLVAVDVDPPECAVGFVRRDVLLRKASLLTVNSSDLQYREGAQRSVPGVRGQRSRTLHMRARTHTTESSQSLHF